MGFVVCSLLFNALLAQQLVLLGLDLGVDLGALGRFVAVVSSLGWLEEEGMEFWVERSEVAWNSREEWDLSGIRPPLCLSVRAHAGASSKTRQFKR